MCELRQQHAPQRNWVSLRNKVCICFGWGRGSTHLLAALRLPCFADPTRRALAKMQPLMPALPAGSSGVEAKAPDVGEEKEDDSLGAFLRGRTQSRSSAPVVTMATSRPSGSKHTPVLPTSPLALLTALPRGAVLPSRSPQLSGAAQKALMMLPPERLKHLTAEPGTCSRCRNEQLFVPPPPPGGSAVSKTSSALVASPPGKSSASVRTRCSAHSLGHWVETT
jgi:hypothetical protein